MTYTLLKTLHILSMVLLFGTGLGSAWLRAGSAVGPVMVGVIVGDLGIRYVFAAFAAVAAKFFSVSPSRLARPAGRLPPSTGSLRTRRRTCPAR